MGAGAAAAAPAAEDRQPPARHGVSGSGITGLGQLAGLQNGYPYVTTGTVANTITFGGIPYMQPVVASVAASALAEPEEIAWLKRRVREIEWRP